MRTMKKIRWKGNNMREVLFRGKSIDNGKWVYGFYLQLDTSFFKKNRCFINISGTHAVEVQPKTVGQYTGMKDKNGTNIFEGDCLGHKDNVVEFSQGIFNTNGDSLVAMQLNKIVVGNIHDCKECE